MADHIQIGDISPRIQFTGDGAQTIFTYPFPIFKDADIEVYEDTTLKTLATHYTVSGAGNSSGGSVTFTTAPANSVTVTLLRNIAIQRTSDFQESGEFRSKVINDELDTLTASLQQVGDEVSRSLSQPTTDASGDMTLPDAATRALMYLGFDANGDPVASAGLALGGTLLFDGSTNPEILGNDADGALFITASTATNLGGNIGVYSENHGAKANDIDLRVGSTNKLSWDNSNNRWDFQGEEVNNFSDLTFSGVNPEIRGMDSDGALFITAGTTVSLGANIGIYGDTHTAKAHDIDFRTDANNRLSWDNSEINWDFNTFAIIGVGAFTASGVMSVAADTDTDHTFGRTVIGSFAADHMVLSHVDSTGGANIALSQSAVGLTTLNAKAGQSVKLAIGNSTKMQCFSTGGFTIGSPTGGDKGAGTLNAVGVYDDNTLLTCYVFEQYLDGTIDDAKWDAKVPDRVQTEEKDPEGNISTPASVEVRSHGDMRKFKGRIGTATDPLDLEKYIAHWKTKRHLTALPNEANFDPADGMTTGQWIQRLVETVETQAIHISQLNDRIKALEAV